MLFVSTLPKTQLYHYVIRLTFLFSFLTLNIVVAQYHDQFNIECIKHDELFSFHSVLPTINTRKHSLGGQVKKVDMRNA